MQLCCCRQLVTCRQQEQGGTWRPWGCHLGQRFPHDVESKASLAAGVPGCAGRQVPHLLAPRLRAEDTGALVSSSRVVQLRRVPGRDRGPLQLHGIAVRGPKLTVCCGSQFWSPGQAQPCCIGWPSSLEATRRRALYMWRAKARHVTAFHLDLTAACRLSSGGLDADSSCGCRAQLRTESGKDARRVQDPEELWAVYHRAGGRLTRDSMDEEDQPPRMSKRRQRMQWSCAPWVCLALRDRESGVCSSKRGLCKGVGSREALRTRRPSIRGSGVELGPSGSSSKVQGTLCCALAAIRMAQA